MLFLQAIVLNPAQMKKIIITFLIITSLMACKKKNTDPAPLISTSAKPSEIIGKDSTGKTTGGTKLYYNSQNQITQTVVLDALLNETKDGYIYSYNSDGQMLSFIQTEGHYIFSTKFIYTNGAITQKIYTESYNTNSNSRSDTSYYVYNSDKTLKYTLAHNDSTVYSGYVNQKPGLITRYSKGSSNPSYIYNTYDSNGNLTKEEYENVPLPKYTTRTSTYSTIRSSIFMDVDIDPSPDLSYQSSEYASNNTYYSTNGSTTYKFSEYISSNLKTLNGNLVSYSTEDINYNPNGTISHTDKGTTTLIY